MTQTRRRLVPNQVVSLASEWKSNHIFANKEYEVDELRRDLATLNLCKQSGMSCVFSDDRCIVEPGTLKTKQDKPYAVYSPWLKNWLPTLHDHPEYLEESPTPSRNSENIYESPVFSALFSTHIPPFVHGFECNDKEKMEELWPAGTDAAIKVLSVLTLSGAPLTISQVLQKFLHTKARKCQVGDSSPFSEGSEKSSKDSRVVRYAQDRDRTDFDSSSRLRWLFLMPLTLKRLTDE